MSDGKNNTGGIDFEYEDDELEGLSDEEREALDSDVDESEHGATDDETGTGDDNTEQANANTETADAGTGTATTETEETATDTGSETETESETEQASLQVQTGSNKARTAEEIDQEIDSLSKQFDDGEMTSAEFSKRLVALSTERAKAETLQAMSDAAAATTWNEAVDAFMAKAENQRYKDPIAHAALEASLQTLYADPKASGKPYGWYLEEADKMVRARFGGTQETTTDKGKPSAKEVAEARGAKPAAPTTLAHAPAVDDSGAGDKWADLNKLDGLALEQALARMPEEERNAYLAAN